MISFLLHNEQKNVDKKIPGYDEPAQKLLLLQKVHESPL